MITLNKEIKAFTVLENTPATFKMEVEVNAVTNIDITVDRTNNNKVTATNKQGERIIVLPYLVIEAKQLADDNKPKINLTKTNFDYHKYGKKQVLSDISINALFSIDNMNGLEIENKASEYNIYMEYFKTTSNLPFNLIIHNFYGEIIVNNAVPKYIILKEKSDGLDYQIITTDDAKTVLKHIQLFESYDRNAS